eukprot:CAMPEP_0170243580 /NCGR_PEP_ID=MMETSP0116_2-20130129/21566_1 /TAXON_ID=400756 /ORGANISM="Durinskia baltica, Strain CSIRO CS-38" /LENGTH=45 /DNA_ID= /DNA_START= /DNA_END= /DNA_ORIENTATION=
MKVICAAGNANASKLRGRPRRASGMAPAPSAARRLPGNRRSSRAL